MAETRFDIGFELLPAEGPDITPDEELAAAIAAAEDTDVAADVGVPVGRGWNFDFETGEFRLFGSEPAPVRGVAWLRSWVEKTLRTARHAHPIYSHDYGIDVVDLVGEYPTAGTLASYAAAVEDALLYHDRISAVRDFRFNFDPATESLEIGFSVVLDEDVDGATVIDFDPIAFGG